MFELYRLTGLGEGPRPGIPTSLGDGLELKVRQPSLRGLMTSSHPLYDLYWLLLTRGNCWVYGVFDGTKEVHHSYVTGACFKFPFMKPMDLQIGNCRTHQTYRGKGIYPFVVRSIAEDYMRGGGGGDVYMLIEEDNLPSQRGVSKVGFSKVGHLRTRRLLGLLKVYDPE